MNQHPQGLPSRHSQYEPFRWMFFVRIAQLVLTVLVVALCAFAISQSFLAAGLYFSFWTIAWSIIYVPVAVWYIPRLPARYRPNIIVLVFESLSVLWWLTAFSLLAAYAVPLTAYGLRKRDEYDDDYYTVYTTASSDYEDALDDALDAASPGNFGAASACIKVGTALAAINWALFIATLVAHCIKIHRQRKERAKETYPGGAGGSNALAEQGVVQQVHAEPNKAM